MSITFDHPVVYYYRSSYSSSAVAYCGPEMKRGRVQEAFFHSSVYKELERTLVRT
jgi:hypothetical protein